MKELQPLNENVLLLVEKAKQEKTTASGIIIPDSANTRDNTGKVIAVGTVENPAISEGDIVLYKEFSGKEYEFEGNNYVFVPYSDLLAKIVETE